MIVVGTSDEATKTRFCRVTPNGKRVWRSQYFGPAPSPALSSSLNALDDSPVYVDARPGEIRPPQAFLVEQEAGATVSPHFHYVDQFQVIVDGAGALGRHPVAPLSVHFAAASTGYGPISPGDAGLSYFTFRAVADETGAQYLPQARSRMRDWPRRNVVVERIEPTGEGALQARADSMAEIMLEHDDGLAVHYLRIAAGQSLVVPEPSAGNGLSLLVTRGEIVAGQHRLRAWSCWYVSADEAAIALAAGSPGAEVLVMRYPHAHR